MYCSLKQVLTYKAGKNLFSKSSLITQWADALLGSTIRTNMRTVDFVEFRQIFFLVGKNITFQVHNGKIEKNA